MQKNGSGGGVPATISPQENPHLPIVRPGMTLWEIMDTLDRMEKGLITLTGDEMGAMSAITRQKVDGYKQFTDMAGAVAKMIAQWEEELSTARSSIEGKVAGLKAHMAKLMMEHKFERLPGHIYEARLQKNSAPKVTIAEPYLRPDSDLYRKFPDLIRRTYSWDSSAVAKALEAGVDLQGMATAERGQHVRFGVNKAVE